MRLIFSILAICGLSYGQLVQIAPYNLYQPGVGTQDLVLPNTTDTSITVWNLGSMTRMLMPFTAAVPQYGLYLKNASAITGIDIATVPCTTTSGGHCTVGTASWAAKITGPFNQNSINDYLLATPLTMTKWDSIAITIEVGTPHAANLAVLSSQLIPSSGTGNQTTLAETCYYQTNGSTTPTTLTVASMTLIPNAGCPVVAAYAAPPLLAGIGDSIMAGKNANGSADTASYQGAPVYPIQSSITNFSNTYYWAQNYKAGNPTYQTTGIPGELCAGATGITARITDLTSIQPKYGLYEGCINDIIVTCTSGGCSGGLITTIETAITSAMSTLQTAHIGCFVMLIGPYTAGSTAQMQNADTINANTISTAPTYGCTVIDWRCTVGQFRAGGSGGNCWDWQAAMTQDGLHPNTAGYIAIGGKTYSTLPYISGNSGSSGGSSSSGSGIF